MFDIVFDMDGTLVDSAAQCEAIIDAMRADRGIGDSVPLELCRQYAGLPAPMLVPALLGEAARDPDRDVIEFRTRYAATPTSPDTLYPGVGDGLAQLRDAGLRLSICSAKPQLLCERVLVDTGIDSFFAAIVGGDRTDSCKPDPAHYHATLELAGGTVTRSLLVGDSVSDHQLAANAMVPFLFVTYGYSRAEEGLQSRWQANDFPGAVKQILDLAL